MRWNSITTWRSGGPAGNLPCRLKRARVRPLVLRPRRAAQSAADCVQRHDARGNAAMRRCTSGERLDGRGMTPKPSADRGREMGSCALGALGWSVEFWDGDGRGLRIYSDSENGSLEFAVLYTREEAYQLGILDHCSSGTPGYPPAATDLNKLDSEDTVMLWCGLPDREHVRDFCHRVIAMLDADKLGALLP